MSRSSLPGIFSSDVVQYSCSCGSSKPLCRLYFCRHCLTLRCRDCCSHEVDSQYCQHCLEYIPTIDAKLKKNKCSVCYSCPACGHTLSTRANVTHVGTDAVPKKSFFLTCTFCRWSSRDVGIKDANASSGPWPEHDSVFNARIDQLYDHYKALASREKQLLRGGKRIIPQVKPMSATGHALHLLDKYGISSSMSPKMMQVLREKSKGSTSAPNLQGMQSGKDSGMNTSGVEIKASEAKDNLDDEDDFNEEVLYKQNLDVSSVSTLEQRLRQLETQPKSVQSFLPVPQMLSIKRSLRCKTCDHNLSKPEFNPSSIKFKILLAAFYHVPEIKVKGWSLQEKWLDLSLQNPTPYDLKVALDILAVEDECSRLENFTVVNLKIPPKDETLDIDLDLAGTTKKETEDEDDQRIVGRKGNKAFVRLRFNPIVGSTISSTGDTKSDVANRIKLRFILRHDFVNTIVQVTGSEKRETQIQSVSHKVTVALPINGV